MGVPAANCTMGGGRLCGLKLSKQHKDRDLGPVVQKPVNTNLGLNVNQASSFSCKKAFLIC